MNWKLLFTILVVLFQVLASSYPEEKGEKPEEVPVDLHIRAEWLTHEDNQMRAQSEARLRAWTGQDFYHTWQGYHYQRPTLEEGRRMQPAWQEWWEKNKSNFKPKTQYNSLKGK